VALYWQRTAPDAAISDLAPGPQQQQTAASQAMHVPQPSGEPLLLQRSTPSWPSPLPPPPADVLSDLVDVTTPVQVSMR